MKKTLQPKQIQANAPLDDDLLPHYDFDYSKAKPNRFAGRVTSPILVITLAPDVAEAFPSAKAVNDALRSLLTKKAGAKI